MKFPKGRYYIGDLCYVLGNVWEEVCDLTIQGNECIEGLFKLRDGRKFAMFGTAYGDGDYTVWEDGQYLNFVSVDSGTIGITLLKGLDEEEIKKRKLGIIHTFKQSFDVGGFAGRMSFGNLSIDTGSTDEDDEIMDDDDDAGYGSGRR